MKTPHLRLVTIAAGLAPGVLGATGPGVQIVTQGCTIDCPGCTSSHTHSSSGGREKPLKELLQLMEALHSRGQLARLTVTGGEPTEQAPALQAFLTSFTLSFPEAEVVLYSGRTWPALQREFASVVALCDVVVAGPFVAHRPSTSLTGSDNQTVHLLTERARRLYHDWPSWPVHRVQLSVQSSADGAQRMLMVGIPQRGLAPMLSRRQEAVNVSTASASGQTQEHSP